MSFHSKCHFNASMNKSLNLNCYFLLKQASVSSVKTIFLLFSSILSLLDSTFATDSKPFKSFRLFVLLLSISIEFKLITTCSFNSNLKYYSRCSLGLYPKTTCLNTQNKLLYSSLLKKSAIINSIGQNLIVTIS